MFSLRSGNVAELVVDNDAAFDRPVRTLEPVPGEVVLASLANVVDAKGGANEAGPLFLTNLRVVWCREAHPRTNLSVGLNVTASIFTTVAESRVSGAVHTLHVFARVGPGGGEKLEFLFAARSDATPPLFAAAERVLRAYDGSRLYRDVKLRGALVVRGAPSLLPGETLISRHDDVWNLSGAAGADAGVMTVTNVRVVWHAGFAENFSVSVPFVQLVRVALRDTRAGAALVLQTSQRSGGIFLGFRVDAADSAARPSRRLDALHKEVLSVLATARASPLLGVDAAVMAAPDVGGGRPAAPPADAAAAAAARLSAALRGTGGGGSEADAYSGDDDADGGGTDALAAYYASTSGGAGGGAAPRRIVYDAHLGLAVEEPPPGLTLSQLWEVAV